MKVLGAIAIRNIKSIGGSPLGKSCFIATNMEADQWDLCAKTEEERKAWIEAISAAIGIKPTEEKTEKEPEKITVV